MKKISYKNYRHQPKPKVKPCDLPSVPEAEEGLTGSPSLGIGRGLSMPGEPVMPPVHTEEEERPYFTEKKDKKFSKPLDYDDLLNMII